jgi:quercetin dioxygenase-like cupin family protein
MQQPLIATYRWDDVRDENLGPVQRRFVNGDALTLARMELIPGEDIPGHAHSNEQISWVISGAVEVTLRAEDGEKVTLRADDLIHIPGDVWHKPRPLEPTLVVEVFTPKRSDWPTEI